MPTPKPITSADNPRIKAAGKLRDQRGRRAAGLCLVESVRQLDRAIEAGLSITEMFICLDLLADRAAHVHRIFERCFAADRDFRGYHVPQKLLAKLAVRERPDGVVAVCRPPTFDRDELLERVAATGGLCLVAMGIEKPGNLGAMARSAEAAGAGGILLVDPVVDAFNPNVIRASTGAVFRLPVVAIDGETLLASCERLAIDIMAATPDADAVYTDVDMTGPTAIVIGAEDAGLPRRWRERSGVTPVRIAMGGSVVDSLNASVAAAVLMFESARQRRLATQESNHG
jgi:TrmH family RNA methyltransferase